jgi:hypothetical protein
VRLGDATLTDDGIRIGVAGDGLTLDTRQQ